MKQKMIISLSILVLISLGINGETYKAPLGGHRGATGGETGEQFFHTKLGYVNDQPTHDLIRVNEDEKNPKRSDRILLYNQTNPEYIQGREIGRQIGHYEAERGIDVKNENERRIDENKIDF